MNNAFSLYSTLIPAKGFERSVLCDLEKEEYVLIPNGLFDILNKFNGCSLKSVKRHYKNEFDETIDAYFEFLEKEEYIFFTDTPQYFPKMDLRWEEPFTITNAIIDIGSVSTALNWSFIIQEFEKLGCKHIRFGVFQINHSLFLRIFC